MRGEFDIRMAEDGDLDAMGALYGAIFDPMQPRMAVTQYLSPPGAFALVAYRGDVLAGFIIGQSITTEAEIFSVGVSGMFRRRGVGGALVENFCVTAAALNAGSVFLEVAVDNPGAVSLYEDLAFLKVGRRKDYYRDPGGARIDAIVMRFDLVT